MNAITILFAILFCVTTGLAHAELKNGMDADVVLGQPDFGTTAGGTTQRKVNAPHGIFTDGQRFFITEVNNNRVLIWNSIPTANYTPADVVLGQASFTTSAAGAGQSGFNGPRGVCYAGGKLFVADWGNNRVLIWNTLPTVNNAPADVVVGQPDFDTVSLGVSQSKMYRPNMLHSDGNILIVPDEYNNRVLIFKSIPVSNNAPADVVIGQSDFTTNSSGTTRDKIDRPNAVFFDGERLFISEYDNNRVIIYKYIPLSNGASADLVLGQPDFMTSASGVGPNKFYVPGKLFSDGKRLYLPDVLNNRIIVWNNMPVSNNASADIVIGQPDFYSNSANQGGSAEANTNSRPADSACDGKRLIVSEFDNNRVLIYNIGSSSIKLGPQFDQGKALIGKVFNDVNGNGIQDDAKGTVPTLEKPQPGGQSLPEQGIEGVKVVTDTGIYAITDSDGKYHFPYIEVGQHLLKIDASTLPEGSVITTDNPYKVTVTEGILTKVSFGVRLPSEPYNAITQQRNNPITQEPNNEPLLKVSVSQDPVMLKPRLSISHKIISDKGTVPTSGKAPTWGTVPSQRNNAITQEPNNEQVEFTIQCNYFLFIARSKINIYDKDYKLIKQIDLPNPIPFKYTLPLNAINATNATNPINAITLFYQLSVYDKNGKEDRTGIGKIEIK